MDALSLSSVLTVLQAPLVPGLDAQALARPLLWALTLGGVVHGWPGDARHVYDKPLWSWCCCG